MKLSTSVLISLLVLLPSACSTPTTVNIQAKDTWVRAAAAPEMGIDSGSSMPASDHVSGGNSAAYMVLQNSGNETDRLVRVTTEAAESAGLHVSQTENDVTSMRPVEAIEVPPQGETELKPGGLHIMLIGLKHELKAGDKVKLTLEFEKAGTLYVEAEVRAP